MTSDSRAGFDDFPGDRAQVVDLHDALDLSEQALNEAEVATGDAGDGRDGFGVGEVIGGQSKAQLGPVVLQDKEQLGGGQRPVLVDEPDPAAELRVPGETFFGAGHADQDHAEAAAVVVVAKLLQGRGLEPVGLVDDEQLDE
jgi:hypothetical protein